MFTQEIDFTKYILP